ncbi:MAG TPA: OmpH family outer membrane protein [Rhizomicrobium sp.]|nr:OmpH family outer membrane protein [Rhizomicrobium sp.]
MKSLSICACLAALAISFASSDVGLAANGPHILVIDRRALIQTSKLGQSIQQQLMAYNQKAQTQFGPEGQALQNEQQALESGKLPAAERAKRQQAFQARQAAFQQKMQSQRQLLEGGQMAARKYFMDQVDQVVHAIMAERGADAVLDKNTVVASGNGADITKEAVQRLDQKAPSYKVQLVKPSLQDMLQMQGAGGMPQGQQ